MNKLFVPLLFAPLLFSAPVAAQSSALASFSELSWSLVDLNPNDGIDPSINFNVNFPGVQKFVGRAETFVLDNGAAPKFTAQSGDVASSSASSLSRIANASVSDRTLGASGGAQNNDGLYSASSWLMLNIDFDPRKSGKMFELSANTAVTFAALADIATTGGASAEVWLLAGSDLRSWRNDGQQLLQATFSNTTNASGLGFVNGNAHVDFGLTAPVPEPETYALMLLGAFTVGWVTKQRRRAAAVH